jgi:choline dehydrogenase
MAGRFDVLVVGGGSAGCVLAARLSEEPGRSVCLVEAGPDYGPYDAGRWPADILDARRLAFSHSWETDREDRSQLRARILGGCSSHNACVVLRGTPADYDEWGDGWRAAELEPYLSRAERALRTRRTELEELSPLHRAFADAAGDDALVHDVNVVGTVRWNTAFAYLDGARGRPNLTIVPDSLVDRVLADDGAATGVLVEGRTLSAATVVLSAGAYGSPGILLRSGIGPATELRRHGIGIVADLPVGSGLADHVGVGIGWEPTDELQAETTDFEAIRPLSMAAVSIKARSSACGDGEYDLLLFPAVDPGYEISAAVFHMKPASRGSVRLHSHDPRAPLAVEHGFLADPRDADALAEGVEQLRALAARPPVRRYVARELRPGPDVTALAHVRQAARGFFHPTGTCALGSVVEANGRVRGFANLYVADASIIPTIPRANTNLSTVALAERIAELLG